MPIVFALAMLVSAALLFVVQPMIAKMVLPLLGGSPEVWNTCMVFFQAALLAGYAYAHATTALLGARRQAVLHVGLLLLPFAFLPLRIPAEWLGSPPSGANPSPWLLGLLTVAVGLPFFVVSTTAPLLQRWFSGTGHPAAVDPYFLYGASNIGSMVALLGYPIVVEPNLRFARQSQFWAVGYGVFVVLILACAVTVWRAPRGVRETADDGDDAARADRPGLGRWSRWVGLAFVPSSLMLGVTTYLTTDIAAIPLLWVIPLAIYLLTFILVFARRPPLPHPWMVRVLPMAIVLLVLIFSLRTQQLIFIPIHLLAFFMVALVCHGELARLRPSARHLTGFYLAMSLGGVLGGIFNALVAPILFDRVAEYPLALVLACLALPRVVKSGRRPWDRALDFAVPLAVGVLLAGVVPSLTHRPGSQPDTLVPKLGGGVASFLCYTFKDRPVRFALGVGAVLLAFQVNPSHHGRILLQERNFFGVLRVAHDLPTHSHVLIHGNTLHGQQGLDPGLRREPMTYYHRTGPIGQVFEAFGARPARPDVAVVGLGAGSLACYAAPGQGWTFYEIDPAVVRIARDPRFFTYLKDCRARSRDVVVGDARLRLRDAPDGGYGLIVLDAFSSDAIPMHLLTREALRLYRDKLADGGLIAFHISNRYLDLAPVLGALARDAGLIDRVRRDRDIAPEQAKVGKTASDWIVMAAREEDLGPLGKDPRWKASMVRPDEEVWTDDFSNIIQHFIIGKRLSRR
ncbi:MAG: fused MFS/spermidine synthase [Singulisphaera sp.]